jgi:hypothetical protein
VYPSRAVADSSSFFEVLVADHSVQEQMTANFIELVLEPLFSALVAYFPSMGPQQALLLANKRKWRGCEAA